MSGDFLEEVAMQLSKTIGVLYAIEVRPLSDLAEYFESALPMIADARERLGLDGDELLPGLGDVEVELGLLAIDAKSLSPSSPKLARVRLRKKKPEFREERATSAHQELSIRTDLGQYDYFLRGPDGDFAEGQLFVTPPDRVPEGATCIDLGVGGRRIRLECRAETDAPTNYRALRLGRDQPQALEILLELAADGILNDGEAH